MQRIVLFGAGYSARAYVRHARTAAIAGTTRTAGKHEMLRAHGITPLHFDGRKVTDELAGWLAEATAIVVSVAPDEEGDPVLRAAGRLIEHEMPALQWIGYLSTLGVYGDHGGAWINERAETRPVSARSRWRLAAEQAWQALGERRAVPVALLRIAGIYGPGRNAFVRLSQGSARRIVKPGQVFNRIHVEDIGRAIALAALRKLAGPINLADGAPAPAEDVMAFAARLGGFGLPPEIPFESAAMSPMERSFYLENKRATPARLLAEGFTFLYPDYASALTQMWRDGSWQAE